MKELYWGSSLVDKPSVSWPNAKFSGGGPPRLNGPLAGRASGRAATAPEAAQPGQAGDGGRAHRGGLGHGRGRDREKFARRVEGECHSRDQESVLDPADDRDGR